MVWHPGIHNTRADGISAHTSAGCDVKPTDDLEQGSAPGSLMHTLFMPDHPDWPDNTKRPADFVLYNITRFHLRTSSSGTGLNC